MTLLLQIKLRVFRTHCDTWNNKSSITYHGNNRPPFSRELWKYKEYARTRSYTSWNHFILPKYLAQKRRKTVNWYCLKQYDIYETWVARRQKYLFLRSYRYQTNIKPPCIFITNFWHIKINRLFHTDLINAFNVLSFSNCLSLSHMLLRTHSHEYLNGLRSGERSGYCIRFIKLYICQSLVICKVCAVLLKCKKMIIL